jgi:hypothetical protein
MLSCGQHLTSTAVDLPQTQAEVSDFAAAVTVAAISNCSCLRTVIKRLRAALIDQRLSGTYLDESCVKGREASTPWCS